MPLKVELKPDERLIVGDAIIRNGGQRVRLYIEGHAPVLREKDYLTAETADTPAKKIYLAVQALYLRQNLSEGHEAYQAMVAEFAEHHPTSATLVSEINNRILSGDLYKALKAAKRLVAHESGVAEP